MWQTCTALRSLSSSWHCRQFLALCTRNTKSRGSRFSLHAEFPLMLKLPRGSGQYPPLAPPPSVWVGAQAIPPAAQKSAPAARSPSIPQSCRPNTLEWWWCRPSWYCNGPALGTCSWGGGAQLTPWRGRWGCGAGSGRRFPNMGRWRTRWRLRLERHTPHPENNNKNMFLPEVLKTVFQTNVNRRKM